MKISLSLKKLSIIIISGFIILLLGCYLWITRNDQSTDDASIDSDIASISSKVSGHIVSLNIKDNQYVRKNDILVQIDPQEYQYAVEIAKAEYEAALSILESSFKSLESVKITAPSEVDAAQSEVDAARSKWIKANTDLKRIKRLDDIVASKQQLDDAITNEQTAKFNFENKLAQLYSAQTAPNTVDIAQSKINELQANLNKAKANLSIALLNLDNTKIIAPFDGKITKKNITLGNFVQPGQKLLALVDQNYWVIANYKENQIYKMRPGQKVKIKIDAFPDLTLSGRVDSIQSGTGSRFSLFPPENATGNFIKVVQRVPVKIIFDSRPSEEFPVGPGMSVEPIVYTE